MQHFFPQKMNSSKLPLSCLLMADSARPEKIAKMKVYPPLPSERR
jgi:hypothetical protein